MRHPPHVLGLLLLIAGAPSRVSGENLPSLFASPPPLPNPPTPPPPRAISAETAAKLAALAPKFEPGPAPSLSDALDLDNVEAGRPSLPGRPAIVRLPSYIVTEPKIKLPSEHAMLTPRGRLELALRRNPGLRLGELGPLNNNFWANALLDEDRAKERTAEVNDLFALLPGPRRPRVILTAPPKIIPQRSGPYGGLLVPWERR